MRDFAALSDLDRNPQFQRRWSEPPQLDGFRSIGEVVAELTDTAGRAAIVRLLERAGQGDRYAFEQADQIRQRLGLTWDDLLAGAA